MYDLTGDVQSLPNGCKTSCAISGQQCPLEQPSSPGMEPDTCWDGSHKKGNRPVCVFEERQNDNWGPRKYFCAAPGYAGAWCKKDSHCGAGSVCSFWRCTRPKKDYEICGRRQECISNRCEHVWGSTKKCVPTNGWRDRNQCVADSHCSSKSCVHTFGTDKKCKPTIGWNHNEQCTADGHCRRGQGLSCEGGRCKKCSSNIRAGQQWKWTEYGRCAVGCCNTDGSMRSWSQKCSTGITKHKQWQWTEHGRCAVGCCMGCCGSTPALTQQQVEIFERYIREYKASSMPYVTIIMERWDRNKLFKVDMISETATHAELTKALKPSLRAWPRSTFISKITRQNPRRLAPSHTQNSRLVIVAR